MRRVAKKGVAHLAFPFPTGETVYLPAADGVPEDVERIAQACVRARAKTWAHTTFPKAFYGLPY
jgi:hypothetical protein